MPSNKKIWVGRILSGTVALFLLTSGINLMFVQSPGVKESFALFGYPAGAAVPIGFVEFLCALIYLIPRTAVLGAVLLTGYLGGAVATHVRVSDPTFVAPIVVGVIVWLALFLRDQRVRGLLAA